MVAIHEAAGTPRNGLAGILAWIEDARERQAATDTLVECVRRAKYARPHTRSLTADELEAEHDLRIALDAFEP